MMGRWRGTTWGYRFNYLPIRMTLITDLKCCEVSLFDMRYLSLVKINNTLHSLLLWLGGSCAVSQSQSQSLCLDGRSAKCACLLLHFPFLFYSSSSAFAFRVLPRKSWVLLRRRRRKGTLTDHQKHPQGYTYRTSYEKCCCCCCCRSSENKRREFHVIA